MQDQKSQPQNKDKAMRVLRARLLEHAIAEQQAELGRAPLPGRHRRPLGEDPHLQLSPGTRDRPPHQAHLAQLDEVLGGGLEEFTEALAAEEKRARLEQQAGAGAA